MKIPNILTDLAHVYLGVLVVVTVLNLPLLSVILTAVFLIYQRLESIRIGDLAYRDIGEFQYGLVLGTSIMVILLLKPLIG